MFRGKGFKITPGDYYVQRRTGKLAVLVSVDGLKAVYKTDDGEKSISPNGFRVGFRPAQPGEITTNAPTR